MGLGLLDNIACAVLFFVVARRFWVADVARRKSLDGFVLKEGWLMLMVLFCLVLFAEGR
jgi:hypothetical protein